jgi:Flp pilus assembly protein TadD
MLAGDSHREGLRLVSEKDFRGAAARFAEAARLEPTSAQYANDTGWAYYKLGAYDDALVWLQKAIALDPQRAVAFLNLGDVEVMRSRQAEARRAYETYVALEPNAEHAEEVRGLLKNATLPDPP